MGKFNQAVKPKKPVIKQNFAGGLSYGVSEELELVSLLLSSFLKDKFYESGEKQLERLQELAYKIDPEFLAKASLYARNEAGMRSVSHVIAANIARMVKGKSWTRRYFNNIIHRPDDMLEILSYFFETFDDALPNSVRKGFGDAFQRFDEYQLAKYKAGNKKVHLVDVVNIIHPKSTPAIAALVNGTLKAPETWEVKKSAAGDDEELKTKAWKDLIRERKMPYFALLRNIRNIMAEAPEMVDEMCDMLQDEKLIKKSLVLPFRYITALDNINTNSIEGRKVLVALSNAVEISMNNLPKMEGRTLTVIDTSGSMEGMPAKISSLFAAVISKATHGDIMVFSNTARYVNYNPMDSVLSNSQKFRLAAGGTNFPSIFDTIDKHYDRIIVLSDMQGWGHGWDKMGDNLLRDYEKKFGKTKLYSWDLKGSASLMFPQKNVAALAGWSDKAFDLLALLDKGEDMTKVIRNIEL